jgi:hypothetical protein
MLGEPGGAYQETWQPERLVNPVGVTIGADGTTRLHEVARDMHGPWRKYLGSIQLITDPPVKNYTALALPDPETLLAAGDGELIALERSGVNWKERTRWSDSFGSHLKIAINGSFIVVYDSSAQQILKFRICYSGDR